MIVAVNKVDPVGFDPQLFTDIRERFERFSHPHMALSRDAYPENDKVIPGSKRIAWRGVRGNCSNYWNSRFQGCSRAVQA